MRARAYLWAVLLSSSCSVSSPCEEQGGVCVWPETACAANERFVGFDPGCEPMSKCCVPLNGKPADAGSSRLTEAQCAAMGGKCRQPPQAFCQPDLVKLGTCTGGNECCASR